jgi:uncharacterized protein (DUF3820 family)
VVGDGQVDYDFDISQLYAQVTNAEGYNHKMKKLYEDRVIANRRTSAELSACILELPRWYMWWLKRRCHNPERAAANLIAFSNTIDFDAADKLKSSIRRSLGFRDDE